MTDDLLRKFAELNPVADPDRHVALDASDLPADPVLRAVLEHTWTNGDRPYPVRPAYARSPWPTRRSGAAQESNGKVLQAAKVRPDQQPTAHRRPRTLAAVGAAAVILAAMAGLVAVNDRDPAPAVSGDADSEVTELLKGFLEARIAGEAAQQYLNVPEEDIPLLYATSSGAPYERATFESVAGIEWPYGFIAFKVRLFAGDTLVEQLFFTPQHDPEYFAEDGRLRLEYDRFGFATDIAPTTEDGRPVALPYAYSDGRVTLRAAHPWVVHDHSPGGPLFGRLIPERPGVQPPTTDGGQRHDWDELVLLADPRWMGPDCHTGPAPANAAALAESIRSDPRLEATAPVAVSAGTTSPLMMDVKIEAGASICTTADPLGNIELGVMRLVFDQDAAYTMDEGVATGVATGEWMRLFLFDAPEGPSMRILAIAVVAPESSFERAVEAAAPVVDSVEFDAP